MNNRALNEPLAAGPQNAGAKRKDSAATGDTSHEIVIVGGGAAGIAVAASLLARRPGLDIAVIDPADVHYYQPGWTLGWR